MKPARAARTKAPAMIKVPQSRDEVGQAIARIGELEARISARKAEADEAVRAAGEAFVRDTEQLTAELKDTKAGVQTWCEAHRSEITGGDRTKTVEFGTGRILWRLRPPRVTIRAPEAVIEACKRLGLPQFVRVKEEVSKEAMLAEPEKAKSIQGVSIGTEGEDFVIEPAELATGVDR